MLQIETSPEFVKSAYRKLGDRIAVVRERLNRPMTFAEKVLLGHLVDPAGQELDPGESYLQLQPDRIAMQDATAQMALLQFMQAGREETAVPTTVCTRWICRPTALRDSTWRTTSARPRTPSSSR